LHLFVITIVTRV